MLTLTNLSTTILKECLLLRVESWQDKYVRPVAESIAYAYVEPEQFIPLAITKDGKPVGFMQFRLNRQQNFIVIQDFLIDYRHQANGFAVDALRRFTVYAESLEPYERIYCKVDIGNQIGRRVLENAGFMRGHVDLENKKNDWVYIIR